mgnify:FL=1
MTVRVTKPAFNLRDKLNQLDYGHVPYEKMPAGSIVQSKIKYTNNTTWGTSNASWTSIGPVSGQVDFTMKFSPRFHNSILVFETDMTTMLNDDDGYARFRLVDLNHPNGTTVFHSNTFCAASHYKISTDDWINTHICTKGPVQHMGEHNLVLQVYVYNGGTLSFSWSSSDYRTVKVTEIRQ